MQPGDEIPTVTVTPDQYLTVRYAGASGDFNPIHIDDEFARSGRPPGPDPARPVDDGPGRARADRGRRRPARAASASGPVPRHGRARAGDHGHRRRVATVEGGVATVDAEAEQDGSAIIRNAEAELQVESRPGRRDRLLESGAVLTPRQELILRKVVDGLRGDRQPVGSKALAADPDVDGRPVDDPQRARGARGARAARAPAHVARAACRPTPGYRYFVDRLLPDARRAAPRRSSSRSCAARSTRRCA